MRIYKNRPFARFAKKAGLNDASLCLAVHEAENGLIAADLGGGIIKQRVARSGSGKSGGYRTLILYRARSRAFFVHGFAKNERDNVDANELAALRKLASTLQTYDSADLSLALANKTLIEVHCDEETIP